MWKGPETCTYANISRTPDGTTLLATTASSHLHNFILPPDLLSNPNLDSPLRSYTSQLYPTPLNSFTPYPLYNLSSPSTTLVLVSLNALPIRLINTLSPRPAPVSSYPLINPTTEAYLTPSSLIFSSSTTFLAGTDCLISQFDIARNGSRPVTSLPTIPSKRHKMKGGGVGMRGIISTLSIQPTSGEEQSGSGMLAAGTWTRQVGLYDTNGMGGTVATWSIAEVADQHAGIGGTGVTQTLWSSCGRYLYVAERQSIGMLVYDVRVTSKLVGWLSGREAKTNQRLSVDVFPGERGTEVWSGGTDGVVRVWENVGLCEGAQECSWSWRAHDDSVGSTVVHSSGTVVATCSGQRTRLDEAFDDDTDASSSDEESSSTPPLSASSASSESGIENSLKVWAL